MSEVTTDANLPLVLTKRDIADVLHKSVRTVDRLDRAGRLPEPVIPGRWSRDVFLKFLNGGSRNRQSLDTRNAAG